jgi:hypothetical protein
MVARNVGAGSELSRTSSCARRRVPNRSRIGSDRARWQSSLETLYPVQSTLSPVEASPATTAVAPDGDRRLVGKVRKSVTSIHATTAQAYLVEDQTGSRAARRSAVQKTKESRGRTGTRQPAQSFTSNNGTKGKTPSQWGLMAMFGGEDEVESSLLRRPGPSATFNQRVRVPSNQVDVEEAKGNFRSLSLSPRKGGLRKMIRSPMAFLPARKDQITESRSSCDDVPTGDCMDSESLADPNDGKKKLQPSTCVLEGDARIVTEARYPDPGECQAEQGSLLPTKQCPSSGVDDVAMLVEDLDQFNIDDELNLSSRPTQPNPSQIPNERAPIDVVLQPMSNDYETCNGSTLKPVGRSKRTTESFSSDRSPIPAPPSKRLDLRKTPQPQRTGVDNITDYMISPLSPLSVEDDNTEVAVVCDPSHSPAYNVLRQIQSTDIPSSILVKTFFADVDDSQRENDMQLRPAEETPTGQNSTIVRRDQIRLDETKDDAIDDNQSLEGANSSQHGNRAAALTEGVSSQLDNQSSFTEAAALARRDVVEQETIDDREKSVLQKLYDVSDSQRGHDDKNWSAVRSPTEATNPAPSIPVTNQLFGGGIIRRTIGDKDSILDDTNPLCSAQHVNLCGEKGTFGRNNDDETQQSVKDPATCSTNANRAGSSLPTRRKKPRASAHRQKSSRIKRSCESDQIEQPVPHAAICSETAYLAAPTKKPTKLVDVQVLKNQREVGAQRVRKQTNRWGFSDSDANREPSVQFPRKSCLKPQSKPDGIGQASSDEARMDQDVSRRSERVKREPDRLGDTMSFDSQHVSSARKEQSISAVNDSSLKISELSKDSLAKQHEFRHVHRKLPFANKDSNLPLTDGWSLNEVELLKAAHTSVSPTSVMFWSEVSSRVPEKTAAECRSKWFALVETPVPCRTKETKSTNPSWLAMSVGEDDIFDSTPFRMGERLLKSSNFDCLGEFDGSAIKISDTKTLLPSTNCGHLNADILQPKVVSKAYLQQLKRGISEAQKQKKKTAKNSSHSSHSEGRCLKESVHNGDVNIDVKLTPMGTLKVQHTDVISNEAGEDDFWRELHKDDDTDNDEEDVF